MILTRFHPFLVSQTLIIGGHNLLFWRILRNSRSFVRWRPFSISPSMNVSFKSPHYFFFAEPTSYLQYRILRSRKARSRALNRLRLNIVSLAKLIRLKYMRRQRVKIDTWPFNFICYEKQRIICTHSVFAVQERLYVQWYVIALLCKFSFIPHKKGP